MSEIDQVIYFTEGLKPATRAEVAYKSPDTIEKAIELAIRFDTAMFGVRKPAAPKSYNQQNKSFKNQKLSNAEVDQAETFQKNQNSKNENQKERFNRNYYKCRLKKHIAKNY